MSQRINIKTIKEGEESNGEKPGTTRRKQSKTYVEVKVIRRIEMQIKRMDLEKSD
jgi:hypothetical protein